MHSSYLLSCCGNEPGSLMLALRCMDRANLSKSRHGTCYMSKASHKSNALGILFVPTPFPLWGGEAHPTSGSPISVVGFAFSGQSIHFNYTQVPRLEVT